jgi:8-amino-7-oxononanoate synthase
MAGTGERLEAGLAELARDGLLRTRRIVESAQGPRVRLQGRSLANFSGNDYLGLAASPALAAAAHASIDAWGVGSGASALVSGHLGVHEAAEERFARFVGVERALLFGSGYMANLGILAALADRHAEIFSDRLNHACLIDGARLSRAEVTRYPHNDVRFLAARLEASKAPVKVIATDAVFSMDGDMAPVRELVALADRHDAWLVLDDAHGIGVLGACGRGSLDHFGVSSPRIVYMATLGKALGGYGAFVGGAAGTIDWLVQRARTYVFSTALPPMAAAVAHAAIDLLESEPGRVAALHQRIGRLRAACEAAGVPLGPSATAIQPLLVGEAQRAVDLSAALQARGFLVPAIRPPTVPEGTSRLRISLCATHAPEDVDGLAAALAIEMRR